MCKTDESCASVFGAGVRVLVAALLKPCFSAPQDFHWVFLGFCGPQFENQGITPQILSDYKSFESFAYIAMEHEIIR